MRTGNSVMLAAALFAALSTHTLAQQRFDEANGAFGQGQYGEQPPGGQYGGQPPSGQYGGQPPGGQYGGGQYGGQPPSGQYGSQYGGQAPGGQYGGQPPGGQYGGQPPGGQYGGQPPGGQYGGQPPGGQYGGQPPGGQYGGQPPGGQYGGQPPGGQYGGQPPGGQDQGGLPPQYRQMLDQLAQYERRDLGVRPVKQLHSGSMHGRTPNQIPGGQVITTKGLIELIQGQQMPYLLFDVLGANETLPGAIPAVQASQPGSFNDDISKQMGQYLQQVTQGNPQIPLIFYCASIECWMSYNAALRAINLGYSNVLWYRGGLDAWKQAGGPTQPAGGGRGQYGPN